MWKVEGLRQLAGFGPISDLPAIITAPARSLYSAGQRRVHGSYLPKVLADQRHVPPVNEGVAIRALNEPISGNISTGVFSMQRKTVQILGFIFAVFIGQCALGQEHKPVNVGTANGLPFSDGIVAGNTLYLAGQGGDGESGQPVPGGIANETKVALANVEEGGGWFGLH